jgi:hypothetical protein
VVSGQLLQVGFYFDGQGLQRSFGSSPAARTTTGEGWRSISGAPTAEETENQD